MRPASALVATVLALASAASAAPPVVHELFPAGGRRGTTVDAVFGGADLGGAVTVVGTFPGTVGIRRDAKPSASSLPVRFVVPPDARSGEYEVRVVTAAGVSAPRIFVVGDLPEVLETEPNNTPSAAQVIALPAVINGRAGGEDIDCFAVSLKAGQRIGLDCAARGLTSGIEPVVTVRDGAGRELACNEDTPAGSRNVRFGFTAPRDGRFVVEVRESTFKGAGAAVYRLRLGEFPAASVVFPAGGRRGTTVAVTPAGGPGPVPVAIPADAPDRLTLHLPAGEGLEAAAVGFAVGDFDEVLETETGDDPKAAQPLAKLPVTVNARFDRPGDVDRFALTLRKGQAVRLETDAQGLGSPADTALAVLDAAGKQLEGNDDDGTRAESRLTFTAPADGVYTVVVREVAGRGGPDYVYRLTAAPPGADFALTLDADAFTVAPGAAAALVVTAGRRGYDGPIATELSGLPPGVSVVPSPVVIPAGQTTAVATLIAAGNAAPGGAVFRVIGVADAGGGGLRRTATAEVVYVPGGTKQPPVLARATEYPAVGIAGPAPFTLAGKSPELVLTSGMGKTAFAVTVTRPAGAAEAIMLNLLGLPKGVTVDTKTSLVAKGATEGAVNLVVAPGTPTGTYFATVVGTLPAQGKTPAATVAAPAFRVVVRPANKKP
jgi:hypothetical protein